MKKLLLQERRYHLFDSIGIMYCIAPISSILYILLQIIGNVIVPFSVYISANFIDTVNAFMVNRGTLEEVFISLIPLILYFVLDWTWNSFLGLCNTKLDNAVNIKLKPCVLEKMGQLDYKHFENPDMADLLKRIDQNDFLKIFRNLVSFVGFCVKVLGIVVILLLNVWWAAILIIVFSIPTVVLATKGGKANYKTSADVSKHQRIADYLSELLESREAAAERTLFQYGNAINVNWEKEYNFSLKKVLKTKMKWDFRQRLGSLSIVILTFAIMVSLLFPVLNGVITVGLYISLVSNCSQLAFKMQWMLVGKLESIVKDGEYCREFSTFMKLGGQADYIKPSLFSQIPVKIEFREVHFTYPETQRKILNGISFVLEPSCHYAFVGKNGSGKSTIIKLLTGLYRPDAGEILINGENIDHWSYDRLSGVFTTVFQDYAKYHISIRDNLALGGGSKEDEELKLLLEKVEFKNYIKNLKNGYDTLIGKIYEGGIDMSGGEWQKLALCRAMNRPGQVFILDEPTAALSPQAESRLYEQFIQIMEGRTAVFISHRLGSTKLADKILTIDEGVVREQGTQEELLKREGLYYEMYNNQKAWYE